MTTHVPPTTEIPPPPRSLEESTKDIARLRSEFAVHAMPQAISEANGRLTALSRDLAALHERRADLVVERDRLEQAHGRKSSALNAADAARFDIAGHIGMANNDLATWGAISKRVGEVVVKLAADRDSHRRDVDLIASAIYGCRASGADPQAAADMATKHRAEASTKSSVGLRVIRAIAIGFGDAHAEPESLPTRVAKLRDDRDSLRRNLDDLKAQHESLTARARECAEVRSLLGLDQCDSPGDAVRTIRDRVVALETTLASRKSERDVAPAELQAIDEAGFRVSRHAGAITLWCKSCACRGGYHAPACTSDRMRSMRRVLGALNIETGTGTELDAIGDTLGVERKGGHYTESDSDYRLRLRGEAAAKGRAEEAKAPDSSILTLQCEPVPQRKDLSVLTVWRGARGCNPPAFRITLDRRYPMTLRPGEGAGGLAFGGAWLRAFTISGDESLGGDGAVTGEAVSP